MNKFFYTLLISVAAVSFVSCSNNDDPEPGPGPEPPTEDVIKNFCILNRGSEVSQIEGSLSYYAYTYDAGLLSQSLTAFKDANNRSLGVNPTSMAVNGDYLYVVVNGAEKMEIIDLKTLRSVRTIMFDDEKYGEPRQIVISDNIAYITMYNGYITKFDCETLEVIDYTSMLSYGNNPDGIAVVGRYLYVALNNGTNSIDGNVEKGYTVVRVEKDADWTVPTTIYEPIKVGMTPTDIATNGSEIFVLCVGDGVRERSQIWKLNGINSTPYVDGTLMKVDTQYLYAINAPAYSVLPITYKRYSVIDNKQSEDFIASSEGVEYPTSLALDPETGNIIIGSATLVNNGAVSETANGYFKFYTRLGENLFIGTTGVNPLDIIFLPKK